MDNSNKVLSDQDQSMDRKSKVLESIRIGADCECCWTYDARATNLDCWCQIDTSHNVWDIVRCPQCSWDYDDEEDDGWRLYW